MVSKPFVSERISHPGGASASPPAPLAQKRRVLAYTSQATFFLPFISKVFVTA